MPLSSDERTTTKCPRLLSSFTSCSFMPSQNLFLISARASTEFSNCHPPLFVHNTFSVVLFTHMAVVRTSRLCLTRLYDTLYVTWTSSMPYAGVFRMGLSSNPLQNVKYREDFSGPSFRKSELSNGKGASSLCHSCDI